MACFGNAARHLAAGGAFVVEAWIPDLGAFRRNRLVRQRILREDVVSIEAVVLESASQHMRTTQVVLRNGLVLLGIGAPERMERAEADADASAGPTEDTLQLP